MSNINVTPGSGAVVATETIGGADYQKVKIFGAEVGSTSTLGVNPDRSINVSVIGTVGASIIGTMPVVQSGTVISSISGALTLYAPVASLVSGVTSIITSTSQTSVVTTAPGAQRNYITQITVTNGAAVGTFVDVMDGSNVLYSGYAAASGGGYALSFPAPLKQANTVTSLDVKVRTQASVIAAISGFTAA